MIQDDSIPTAEDGLPEPPRPPKAMSEKKYQAIRRWLEYDNLKLRRDALCKLAKQQLTSNDAHSLRLIKPAVRIMEEEKDREARECALNVLTNTITTYGTFRHSSEYKANHIGDLGSNRFIKESLIPLYLPILKDSSHPLHHDAYYVFMTMEPALLEPVVPIVLQQVKDLKQFTVDNKQATWDLVRLMNKIGPQVKPGVPNLVRLVLDKGEVDYEGLYGHDGKRGLNAEIISALVAIGGGDEKIAPLVLEVIDRVKAVDDDYWSDKIRPKEEGSSEALVFTVEQSREKLLKLMGLEAAADIFE